MNHQELIGHLEQYKGEDGTYHIHRLIADENPHATPIEITFATYFGDGFVASELVKLARQLNEPHAKQQQAENDE